MADVQIQKPVEVPEQQPADVPKQEPVEVPKQQPAEVPKQEPTQEPAPAVPDYLSDPDAVLKDVNVKWRYGRPPDYSKTRQVYAQTKKMDHAAGSLPELVQNLVKNWEVEASFKPELSDWRTIDPDNYSFAINGGPPQTAEHMLKVGTYNAIIAPNEYYSPEHSDFASSHKTFKRMMPTFAWEVLEVYSGPPLVAFRWRHWGTMKNDYVGFNNKGEKVTAKAHGGSIDVQGVTVALVDDKVRLQKVETWFDPLEMFRQIAPNGVVHKAAVSAGLGATDNGSRTASPHGRHESTEEIKGSETLLPELVDETAQADKKQLERSELEDAKESTTQVMEPVIETANTERKPLDREDENAKKSMIQLTGPLDETVETERNPLEFSKDGNAQESITSFTEPVYEMADTGREPLAHPEDETAKESTAPVMDAVDETAEVERKRLERSEFENDNEVDNHPSTDFFDTVETLPSHDAASSVTEQPAFSFNIDPSFPLRDFVAQDEKLAEPALEATQQSKSRRSSSDSSAWTKVSNESYPEDLTDRGSNGGLSLIEEAQDSTNLEQSTADASQTEQCSSQSTPEQDHMREMAEKYAHFHPKDAVAAPPDSEETRRTHEEMSRITPMECPFLMNRE